MDQYEQILSKSETIKRVLNIDVAQSICAFIEDMGFSFDDVAYRENAIQCYVCLRPWMAADVRQGLSRVKASFLLAYLIQSPCCYQRHFSGVFYFYSLPLMGVILSCILGVLSHGFWLLRLDNPVTLPFILQSKHCSTPLKPGLCLDFLQRSESCPTGT